MRNRATNISLAGNNFTSSNCDAHFLQVWNPLEQVKTVLLDLELNKIAGRLSFNASNVGLAILQYKLSV